MLQYSFHDINIYDINSNFVCLIPSSNQLSNDVMILDQKLHGIISKSLIDSDITKFGEHKFVHYHSSNGHLKYILIICTGESTLLPDFHFEKLGSKIYSHLSQAKIEEAKILCSTLNPVLIANGALLSSYQFNKYFSAAKTKKQYVKNLEFLTSNHSQSTQDFVRYQAIAEALFLTRDFISEPPNVLFPESYANKVSNILSEYDISVEILSERDMQDLGMNALLGVGQGSIRESKLVIMKYNGASEDTDYISFVGKGVTFDTGGISIKPATGMEEMKYDMAGSAAVVGAMMALAKREAKVNAVGVIALVENMPGGNAQRPSDVVKSMSGQTIEILNTDAEGRLILADALWYTQEKFNPKIIIDLATLTGAIGVAVGYNIYAGLFSNNDELSEQLISSGNIVHERLWRFPMNEEYDKMIDSDIADMKNIGEKGAGSITAAQFLQRFIKPETAWAHLDIASVAWNKKDSDLTPKGAVGFGVRLLDKLVEKYYESE